jgi:hypothetical protein
VDPDILIGHDNLQSPTNEFTKECLDQMGEFSKLLKEDGFLVSMAPPEVSSNMQKIGIFTRIIFI